MGDENELFKYNKKDRRFEYEEHICAIIDSLYLDVGLKFSTGYIELRLAPNIPKDIFENLCKSILKIANERIKSLENEPCFALHINSYG